MTDIKFFFENSSLFGAIGMENMYSDLSEIEKNSFSVVGFHVFSTKPFFAKPENKNKPFKLHDFEIKTAELSALCWKRYNGPIFLVTDKEGEKYFKSQGLEYVYDGILPLLENEKYGIDPIKYWAAGKIEALSLFESPCAIIDLDLIVWRPLNLSESKLTVAHFEYIEKMVYPPFSFFDMSKRYSFPKEWSEESKPLNTAFLYIADSELKNYYTIEAFRFMQYERNTFDNAIKCMVFAEQRILGMCSEAKNIKPDMLIDYDNISEKQKNITHIWTAKPLLVQNKELRKEYIFLCNQKINILRKAETA